jgi:PAS domain-containing protein
MSNFSVHRKQVDHRDGIENRESTIIFETDEQDRLFRSVIRRSLSGLFIFQKDRVVFSNPALQDIVGRTEDEMLRIDPSRYVWRPK